MGRNDMAETVVKATRWTTGHTVIEDRRRTRESLSAEERARFEAATAMPERAREEAIARGGGYGATGGGRDKARPTRGARAWR